MEKEMYNKPKIESTDVEIGVYGMDYVNMPPGGNGPQIGRASCRERV